MCNVIPHMTLETYKYDVDIVIRNVRSAQENSVYEISSIIRVWSRILLAGCFEWNQITKSFYFLQPSSRELRV